jgi:serine O-acetyltransferase
MEFEKNVLNVTLKHYKNIKGRKFFPLNSDHFSMFLYLLSRKIKMNTKSNDIADTVSYINKILHGIDVWHSVELPNEFFFVHPVGTILGQAKYGDFLAVWQGVTIGGAGGKYPTFQGSTVIYSNASVLGNSTIGHNTIIGANVVLLNIDVPPDCKVLSTTTFKVVPNNLDVRNILTR